MSEKAPDTPRLERLTPSQRRLIQRIIRGFADGNPEYAGIGGEPGEDTGSTEYDDTAAGFDDGLTETEEDEGKGKPRRKYDPAVQDLYGMSFRGFTQIQDGRISREAYEDFSAFYLGYIIQLCRLKCRDPEDFEPALDVVLNEVQPFLSQEELRKIKREEHHFIHGWSLRRWLNGKVSNAMKKYWRQKSLEQGALAPEDLADDREDEVEDGEERMWQRYLLYTSYLRALSKASHLQRHAFVAIKIQGVRPRELAKLMGIPADELSEAARQLQDRIARMAAREYGNQEQRDKIDWQEFQHVQKLFNEAAGKYRVTAEDADA